MFLGRRHPTEQHEILDGGLAQNPVVPISTAVYIDTAKLWIYPVKYFMLLRGVPPTQKHVVMIIFKSKYICNENIQDFELQV